MGFAFVLVLVVVFGFVVYKKIEQGRAETGDLLAGVQESSPPPDGTKKVGVNPNQEEDNAKNQPPPQQNFNQFAEQTSPPTQAELMPASFDQQPFEPPQQQVANSQPVGMPGTQSQSLDQFPVEKQNPQEFAPPVETAESLPFPRDSQYQATSQPQYQPTTVAVQPIPETTEFAPPANPGHETFTQTSTPRYEVTQTPIPGNEFAQAPAPQGFEPPPDLSNQPVPQEIPVVGKGTDGGNAGGNPFAVGGLPEQPNPSPAGTGFENEQFSTQSQPIPQEFAPPTQEIVETPPTGNPFGSAAPTEQAQPAFQEDVPTQTPATVTKNDPFAPTEVASETGTAQETFAPNHVPEAVPTKMNPIENFPQTIPGQSEPRIELAQPNPLPLQSTEPKQLPVANNQSPPGFGPASIGTQYEPGISEGTTTAQHPVNPAPTELADNSFGPVSNAQGTADFSLTPHGASGNDSVHVHVVRPGDNYWKISKKQYGTVRYFSALARYNQQRIPDPKKMRPGMKVLTPTRDVLESKNPDLFPKFAGKTADVSNVGHRPDGPSGFYVDAQGRPMYRVGQNDTLGGIAHKHLGRFSRWVEIYRLNRHRLKDPNALTLGDVLQLPPDASRVNMVQHASGVR